MENGYHKIELNKINLKMKKMDDLNDINNSSQHDGNAVNGQVQDTEQPDQNKSKKEINEKYEDADLSEFSFRPPEDLDYPVKCGDNCFSKCIIPVGKILLYLGKVGRILFTIGELYFCILVLNIVVDYVAILMCTTATFSTGGCFFACVGIFLYIIGLSVPLTMIFWETFRFRWLRCHNPFQTILDIFFVEIKENNTIVKVKKWVGLGTDAVSSILILALIITYFIYEKKPEQFESMCLIFFFFVPAIKINIILLIYLAHSCCALFSNNYEFTNDKDPFLISLQRKQKADFCCKCVEEEKKDKQIKAKESVFFAIKLIGVLFGFIYQIVIIAKRGGDACAYLLGIILLIIIFIFSLSISFPIWILQIFSRWQPLCEIKILGFQLCQEDVVIEAKERVGGILKTEQRFFGFKYLNLLIRIILILVFAAFPAFSWKKHGSSFTKITDSQYGSWNGTYISGNYPKTSQRDTVRNAMCFTNIHYLNMVQLEALAQISYFKDIEDVKVFMKNSIFREDADVPVLIDDIKFLTNKDDDGVLLKVDLHVPSSSRNVTVFSIRGSTTDVDWWLDFELLASSALFTLARRIPIITRTESRTASILTRFMTLPIRHMNEITLSYKYTKTLFKAYDDYMYDHKDNNNTIIFVGHSLGGAMSKIMANKYAKQSVAISGPGITPIEQLYRPKDQYDMYFKSTFIDVVPDNDIVPRVETEGGVKYRLLCENSNYNCHSIERTLCMTGILCGQEYYTGDLCSRLFDREEIDKMKETATRKSKK